METDTQEMGTTSHRRPLTASCEPVGFIVFVVEIVYY